MVGVRSVEPLATGCFVHGRLESKTKINSVALRGLAKEKLLTVLLTPPFVLL